jgi:hypothetical protein
MMVQETRMKEQDLAAASACADKVGFGWHGGPAYLKNKSVGGGVAVLSTARSGLRRLTGRGDVVKGRLTLGITDLGGDIIVASGYGVSGGSWQDQLSWVKVFVAWVRELGLPFVLGADWQLPPDIVRKAGLESLLDAQIVAPDEPTNALSGRTIDYFLVSRALLAKGWTVDVVHGCRCSPHLPVELVLGGCEISPELCLKRPKPLPIERPIGPQRPGITIDWERWGEMTTFERGGEGSSEALESWFAGAEAELATKFGLARTAEEAVVLGIGRKPEEVWCQPRGRFRDVPDELGMLGHRLAWAAKALRMVAAACGAIEAGDEAIGYIRQAIAVGKRAAAFVTEIGGEATRPDYGTLKKGLRWLAGLARRTHGADPVVLELLLGGTGPVRVKAELLADEIDEV